ncbi:MAG: TolC family protein, partial [Armatimonadetes bacterium]|nr:TolC family protein [Armatimonadota bacterium]
MARYLVAHLSLLASLLLTGRAGGEPAPLTLAELEALARQHNPTLVQAAALLAGAEGRQVQAGQLPRTTLGYEAEDVLLAEPGEAKHALFFEQRFPAGLSAQRALRAAEREEMLAQAEAQRRRVLTSLRQLYYRALAAQEELRLRHELLTVAREAETTTRRLFNVGQ